MFYISYETSEDLGMTPTAQWNSIDTFEEILWKTERHCTIKDLGTIPTAHWVKYQSEGCGFKSQGLGSCLHCGKQWSPPVFFPLVVWNHHCNPCWLHLLPTTATGQSDTCCNRWRKGTHRWHSCQEFTSYQHVFPMTHTHFQMFLWLFMTYTMLICGKIHQILLHLCFYGIVAS